jgi:broad specificity phosphatase PhoE
VRIFLIRHGFSEGNQDFANYGIHGDPQIKLTPLGWAQAIRAGQFLAAYLQQNPAQQPVHIFSSTYRRARETTAGLLHGAGGALDAQNLRMNSRLVEMDFGYVTECKTPQERAQKMPLEAAFYDAARNRDKYCAMDVQHRLGPFIDQLRREAAEHNQQDVIIVAHGITLVAFMLEYLELDPHHYEQFADIENTSIFVIEGDHRKNYTCRQIYNGETGQEVNIDTVAGKRTPYLPPVPQPPKI